MVRHLPRCAALALALTLLLALPSPASAFSISGTITNAAGGAPLANICVQADGQEGQATGSAKSAADGTYSMATTSFGGGDPLAAGAYLVSFHNCSPIFGGTGDWAGQCCTLVDLTNDNPDATVDAAMQQGGYIKGTVTDNHGAALQGICVQSVPADSQFGSGVQADSAADGTYELHNLPPGGHKVSFTGCTSNWVTQWYSAKSDFASGDTITVTAGQSSTADVSMQPGATIHGTVTDAANAGTGIENICVGVYEPDAGQSGPVEVKGGYTAADGTYSVSGLAAGSYKVEFRDCFSQQGFLTKWFDGKADFANADTIGPLAAGDTATANQALDKGGAIEGTVTGTGNAALPSVCVEAYDPSNLGGPIVSQTQTNGAGQYKLTPLIAGDYVIRFRDCAFHPSYAPEWFDDKGASASADTITLAAGQDLTGKDAQLTAGGHIAGRVTDGTNPIENICVRANLDSADLFAPVVLAYTKADGTFDIGTLPSGQYVVQISDCNVVGGFGTQFWDDQLNSLAADRVDVTAASTTNLPHDIVLFPANDTTPPQTSITAAPSGTIATTSARFDYSANEALSSFTCSITKQGGSPQALTCPDGNPSGNHVTVQNLSDGTYAFSVAARDHAGNDDPTPATATFTVALPDTGGGGGGGGTGTGPTGTPPPTPPVTAPAAVKCVVPKLVGLTLKKAKNALKKAHCRLGKVTKKAARRSKGKLPRKGTVTAQRPKSRTTKPAGFKVAVVVAK